MQEKQARYRSTQHNIVRTNGEISARATIKLEHLLTLVREIGTLVATVKMEDSIYDFHTKGAESMTELVRATDTIKNRLVYQLDNSGSPVRLLNLSEVQQEWVAFKRRMQDDDFPWKMDEETRTRFVAAGDAEYHSEELMLKNSATNLFNKIVFSQYLTKEPNQFGEESFSTQSHFFPQVTIDVHCKTELRNESKETLRFSKTGRPLSVDKAKMIALYEQLYKRQLEYKFTDYSYDIEIEFTVSRDDGLIKTAKAQIREKIKNNIESEVLYELRQVEL